MTELTHTAVIPAAAQTVYDLHADVLAGPQWYPTHLHAEVDTDSSQDDDTDLVERWVIDGDTTRTWRLWRRLDPATHTIVFEHVQPKPPMSLMRGEWRFTEDSPGRTTAAVTHRFELAEPDAEIEARLAGDLDRAVPRQLAAMTQLAGTIAELRGNTTMVRASTSLPAGAVESVPAALAALAAGAEWARVERPDGVLVVKRRDPLPEGIHAVTGRYRVTTAPHGVLLEAERTVTASAGRHALLEDARRAHAAALQEELARAAVTR